MRRALDYRVPRFRLDFKSKTRSESNGPERAKAIFPHSFARLADSADNPVLQILATMEGIAKLMTTRRIRDCIDRVVASRKIFVQRRTEIDDRVPSIRIHVATKCRDLVHDIVRVQNSNSPKIDSNRNGSREKIPHLLRMGGSRQIPVEMGMPEYRITHGSANAPRLEACFLERVRDFANFRRWLQLRDHVSRP
jgi:hypothetical protein